MRGVTFYLRLSQTPLAVSTHTPRAGRDLNDFYKDSSLMFQPTRPVRGVTSSFNFAKSAAVFQPTRPVRGVTLCAISERLRGKFQPTRPVRGVTGGQLDFG